MVFTLFKLLDVKSVQSVSFATNFFTFFCRDYYLQTAIASISTLTPFGSPATCTQERAGAFSANFSP